MSDELAEYKSQLSEVLEGLKENPADETLLELKSELSDLVKLLESEAPPQQPEAISSSQDIKKPEIKQAKFQVGDKVLARWISGDKQYHPAKVTAITGSSANRLYMVRFSKQETAATESVGEDCIKAYSAHTFSSSNERSSQSTSPSPGVVGTPSPTPPQAGSATKAPASSKVTKTVSNNNQSKAQVLNNSKAKWKEFQNKGMKYGMGLKKKKIGESSMFKTTESSSSGKLGQPIGHQARKKHKF